MPNKMFGTISILFFAFLLTGSVFAVIPGEQGQSVGDMGMGMLKTAGLVAGTFVAPQLVNSLFMGDNKMAEETSVWSSVGASGGALAGGMALGPAGGMTLGIAGGLVGGIWSGIASAGDTLKTLERVVLSRVVALDVVGGDVFDADYKIMGSDQPSEKFDAEVKVDKSFTTKDKGVYLQYVPIMLTNKTSGKKGDPVDTSILVLDAKCFDEYAVKYNPGMPLSQVGSLPGQQVQFGVPYSAGMPQNDPMADAVKVEKSKSIGWCNVNDKGKINKLDKEVSDSLQEIAKENTKESSLPFVLLMKNLSAESESLNIPNFNCLGPNGVKGHTGTSAKPKVSFDWKWPSYSDGKACSPDLNDKATMYCDSVQFTEQILAKLEIAASNLNGIKEGTALNTDDFDYSEDSQNKVYADNVYAALHFKSYLMLDGYTNDFLNDFESYSKKTFLGFGDKEKNLIDGLIPDKIKFLPPSGELESPEGYKLPNAGLYNVNIRIKYKVAGNYKLYNDTTGVVEDNVESVYVYLEPISASETNPVYSMPLDATVGVDAGVIHRIGYGVDYKGDGMRLNNANDIYLEPSLSSTSTPIVHLDLSVKQDTQTLNGGNLRGVVLQILPKSGSVGAVYDVKKFLSFPAPVYMKINKSSDGGAWAFYSIDVGNGVENAGSSYILWNLICKEKDNFDCESFDGLKPSDDMYRADVFGVYAKVAPLGQLQGIVYGLEWDKDSVIRDDAHKEVLYKGIVYLPESTKQGKIAVTSASDSAYVSGDGVPTTNTSSNEAKLSPLFNDITSIQNIYDLMDSEKICMTDEGAGVRFWWNPLKVYEQK